MNELNLQIKCPECGAECPPPDGFEEYPNCIYTEMCPACLSPITYLIEDGEVKELFDPPIVNQAWGGKGEPGGK